MSLSKARFWALLIIVIAVAALWFHISLQFVSSFLVLGLVFALLAFAFVRRLVR